VVGRWHFGPGFETALIPALRRVDGVRFLVGKESLQAEVYGVGHRFPVRLAVSVQLATRLVEAGAPLTVVLREPASSTTEVA